MTKKELLDRAMLRAFRVAIAERDLIKKEATTPQLLEWARGYKAGLEEGLEVARFVLREQER